MAMTATHTSSTFVAQKGSGSHCFKVVGYSLTRGVGVGKHISSSAFSVGGYQWTILFFPDGSRKEDDSCISAFLMLLHKSSHVKARYSLCLLYPDGRQSSVCFTDISDFDGNSSSNCAKGCRRLVNRAQFESSALLEDDCLTIKCAVTVIKPLPQLPCSARAVAVPRSDALNHFGKLLESSEGSDVSFLVCGQVFTAHRCVLAARSPVFRALLFGSMKEKNMVTIEINDMEAVVFKTLLHFIYTDSLPVIEMDDSSGDGAKEEISATMAQHLLVAADRYGLERLRLICEDKLCVNIDLSSCVTTLILAEQHDCNQLKAACLRFLSQPEILVAAMRTDEFEHLMRTFPSILKEVPDKRTT